MTSVIILAFLAGVLFVWGLPHIVSGVMRKNFKHPLGFTGSPAAAVAAGWISWVVAVLLWHEAPMRLHPRAAFVAAAVGVLAFALWMSAMPEREPRRARKEA